jgi:excinuclease ABC subunit C
MTSILEELPGIGPAKRKALLRHLGSLRAVRGASRDELLEVPGISARDAAAVFRFFDGADAPRGAVAKASERKPTAQKDTDGPI